MTEAMTEVNGAWVPAWDTHFIEHLAACRVLDGFPDYQGSKRERSLQFVRRRQCAIDVGAHVGLWSRPLARVFDRVIAFEPNAERAACWRKNMEIRSATLVERALNDEARLDDEPDTGALDYLKVDTEGTELLVLRGAARALERFHPVVCVEQKAGYPSRHGLPELGAIDFLQSLGAVVRDCMNGVYVLSWEA